MNRLLFVFLLLSSLSPSAQHLEPAGFDRYTTADGLSDNWVTGVAQDSAGFLWLSTMWGLNRFDGHRFVQYHSNNDSSSLPAEELIWGLDWLDNRRLCMTGTAVHLRDTRTGQARNLFVPYHNRKYQFKFNMTMRVKSDATGNLYVLSRSGFYQFNPQDSLVFRFDYYKGKDVPVNHFYFGAELLELDKQRLLIVAGDGLYLYHKPKRKLWKMQASDCPLLAEFRNYPQTVAYFFQLKPGEFLVAKTQSDSLVYIHLDQNRKTVSPLPLHPSGEVIGWRSKLAQLGENEFYLTGHNSGMYRLRLHPQTGAVVVSPQKELAAYLCTGILRDKNNRLLVATNKGLLRQRENEPAVQAAFLPPALLDSISNPRLGDVQVAANKIYVGSAGAGLMAFDKRTMQFEKLISFGPKESRQNIIRGLVALNDATLLVGRDQEPLLYDLKTGQSQLLHPPQWDKDGDWACDVYRDSRNAAWICARNIYRFQPADRHFTRVPAHPQLLDVPAVVAEDRQGNVWLGRHGLARYNLASQQYDRLLDSFPAIVMPDKQVSAATVDEQNTLWFNSWNNGLIGYNIERQTFRHFTRRDGLPDNNVSALLAVGSKVWIACYSGIACLDTRSFRLQRFGKEDGFPSQPVLNGSRFFFDSSAQQLYLAFATAVVRFNPAALLQAKPPPKTFVEEVVINGSKHFFLPQQPLTLPPQTGELMVTIGSINFRDASLQRFAYRIADEAKASWIDLGSQASFSILNLSPGTHRIQVRTSAADHRWPDQVKEIRVTVLPPFWQTAWFRLLAGLALLLLLYLYLRWRISRVQRKEMEKTQLQKLKADDYKAQFELQQISHYFSSSLAGKKTESEVLWDVAQNLIGRMDYEECILYGWNNDRTKMIQKAAYGPKGKPELIEQSGFDVAPGQGIVGYVIQTKEPVVVSDTRTDPRYRVDDDVRLSEICVPILHNGELLGVIDSEHHQLAYFTERDSKILTTIATLIGNKLRQLESEQTLEQKQQELAGINEQLAEARLSALQAQMNPHFVFNALNSIKRMILDGEDDKASRYLSKFALMIRMTLEHSKEVFVTLEENIRYLRAYLEMEQLRFGDSFTYSITVGRHIDATETTIPSMMIQPLVENAIWHGLMQAEGEKKVAIRFVEEGSRLICVVEDNGIGIRQAEKRKAVNGTAHRSVGLENLRRRIKIMNEKYEMGCSLELTDLGETAMDRSGTRVVLQFNLIGV